MQHYELPACLSVDALFFNPKAGVTYENEMKGMIHAYGQIHLYFSSRELNI